MFLGKIRGKDFARLDPWVFGLLRRNLLDCADRYSGLGCDGGPMTFCCRQALDDEIINLCVQWSILLNEITHTKGFLSHESAPWIFSHNS